MRKFAKLFLESVLVLGAKLVLSVHKPKIIAITGSAGKTSVKFSVGSVLKEVFSPELVRVDSANLGTVTGVPLAVVGINIEDNSSFVWFWLLPWFIFKAVWEAVNFRYPKYLVLEVSADKPGGIKKSAAYLKPLVSVVTNVGPSHLQFFGTVEGVRLEKQELVLHGRKDGLTVLSDDSNTAPIRKLAQGELKVIKNDGSFALNAAREIALWLNADSDAVSRALKIIKKPKRRFDFIPGKKGSVIVDSTYNSNPVSFKWTLDEISRLYPRSRKIVVMGDMLELGSESAKLHREIGEYARLRSDYLITIGSRCRSIPSDYYSNDWREVANHILQVSSSGDIILIKASHALRLERIVEKLKEKDGS